MGVPPGSYDWTPDRVETCKAMWLAGETASAIARKMGDGLTRLAVLGKMNRTPGCKRPPSTANAARSAGATNYRARQPQRTDVVVVAAAATPPKPFTPRVVEVESLRKAFADLGPCECKWPVGELFCAAETPRGKPYCPGHTTIAVSDKQPKPVRALAAWSNTQSRGGPRGVERKELPW